ncbi:hypothetical protein Cs308_0377 [Candidatus Chlamydia sanziniae]|uniref:Uncharacterized protein n=1 Tax=Candidatus Chlamydia sanziniae TaxID=1806891 RepID=A0A1A9HU87_9CHLA|nr:hypothetical protein Cs308_0377 [Candidatus Chlamydia sanziniae]
MVHPSTVSTFLRRESLFIILYSSSLEGVENVQNHSIRERIKWFSCLKLC